MLLNKVVKNLRTYYARNDWEKKAIWLAADFPEYVSRNAGNLSFYKFNLEIKYGKHEYLLDSFDYLKQLHEYGEFSFSIKNETVFAEGNNFVTEIHTKEELFILKEVCLTRNYNFQTLGNVIVIDVGMNVGLATLYFASREDVEHVYGFEPFLPTFQQCVRNVIANNDLTHKITSYNYGLANEMRELEVDYDFEKKGQVGIHGTDFIRAEVKSGWREKIELKPILPEIERIIERHPDMDVICKIDCEGGEYDIFKSFSDKGIPDCVKVIMMEWHKKGPEILLDILNRNSFNSVTTYSYRQDVGMIYAFRD